MKFIETRLQGAYIIEPEPRTDNRGFFARAFCQNEYTAHGLNPNIAQCNISFNPYMGTLRGMHYQIAPHAEVKIVRCTAGAIYDVIIDLRPESTTYKQWIGVSLTAQNRNMLYVPEGFAHGFQTLEDNTEVFYMVTAFYHPQSERGIRWDDTAFNISWPDVPHRILSDKDLSYVDFG
jgi:dTDP-4-dehydrorhamnose 3,5-epimerase